MERSNHTEILTFFSKATEVGNCGRIQQCQHAIWHDKKVVFLNQGFNKCNKAFFFLEGEKVMKLMC
jgi:hypothetical protein